jgi:DNA-binding transcriptional regulator YdaS (Cro superfamily)
MDTQPFQDASTCLKAYRDRLGLNQGELADLLGVSQGLISHWETRRLRVSPAMAKHIEAITQGELTRPILRPDLFS